MSFSIFDSTANLVDTFDDRDEARVALEDIVRQDPEAADQYAVFEFDNSAQPAGDAMTVAELGVHASRHPDQLRRLPTDGTSSRPA